MDAAGLQTVLVALLTAPWPSCPQERIPCCLSVWVPTGERRCWGFYGSWCGCPTPAHQPQDVPVGSTDTGPSGRALSAWAFRLEDLNSGPSPSHASLPGGLQDGVSCSGGQQGAELERWGEWSSLYLSVPVGVMTSLGTRRATLGGLGNAGHHVAKYLL